MMSHRVSSGRRPGQILICLLLALSAAFIGATATREEGPVAHRVDEAVDIRIAIHERADIHRLTRLVSIDDVRGLEVLASATPTQLAALREGGYRWEVLPSAVKAEAVMCPGGWEEDGERSWSCYPTYDQYISIMSRFSAAYPDLCRVVDLGSTANTMRPHRLLAVIISDNPDLEEDEPEVLLTSTIHGDETVGFVLTLRLIDFLLEGYGNDSNITNLIDSTEIWINPLANPDGTYRGGDDTVADAIRYYTDSTGGNSGVDGNRNFPDPTGDDHPDGRPWWPETEAMMALTAAETFVLSANFHGGAEVVNYPWDTWERRHPDNDWFIDLSSDWADLVQADSPAGYMTNPYNSGITNGWVWYETRGSRQDWVTYFHGGREVTIELSTTKLVAANELEEFWQWNRRALLDFIGHAHRGIRGVVTDQYERPLAATIEVMGLDTDIDHSTVRTDPEVGDFHRLLLPGLYDLEIRADGCVAQKALGIAVSDGEPTRINASLRCTRVLRPSRRVTP